MDILFSILVMRKLLIFLSGFILAIIIVGIVGFLILKDKATLTMDRSNNIEEKPMISSNLEILELNADNFLELKNNVPKRTIVNFWASWCKPCIDEIPSLMAYAKKNDINLIFISADKNNDMQKDLIKKKMNQLNMDTTYLISSQITDLVGRNSYYHFLNEIGLDYNKSETAIPLLVTINKNGKITGTFNGPNKDELYSEYYNEKLKTVLF